MKEYDVIVIGGGLAGLFAAITAAMRGRRVLIIAKGVGSIAVGGGTIDLLGYGRDNRPLRSFQAGVEGLLPTHPYRLVGTDCVNAAMRTFQSVCEESGYPYTGSLQANSWLPTALGTLKPSGLVPLGMDPGELKSAAEVVVIGFEGLKDYNPSVLVEGLKKCPSYEKRYSVLSLKTGLEGGRDINALDVARWLDSEPGQAAFLQQLERSFGSSCVLLLPPVLGTRPDYALFKKIQAVTQCGVMETVGLPPAVTGFRLRRMLLECLKKLKVKIIEQAGVIDATIVAGRCTEVKTGNLDRIRTYRAESYILATGGFFGGGLQASAGKVLEAVFDLPVEIPVSQEEWSHEQLLFTAGQPFARFGVKVDALLRPVDSAGQVRLENVFVAGKTLAGYDYCQEKSGNGVALATAYRAGCEA